MKLTTVLVLLCCTMSIALPVQQDFLEDEPMTQSSAPTVIMFTKSKWEEIIQGDLRALKPVEIVYEQSRLPDGVGPIIAEVKYTESGTVHSKELESNNQTGMVSTMFTIPHTAETLIIWFKRSNNTSDQYLYDSDFGKNYQFLFNQIVFTDTWHEYVNGHLTPGGDFDVLYNKVRLPWNDLGYLGMGRAWNIFAYAKFSDNGAVVDKILSGPIGDNPIMNARFHIPQDATKVIMWFKFTGYIHTQEWDSNHGANYHFNLSQ